MQTMEFDFSQFDPDDVLSTDVPMPSSPPAWFGVYEDPIEQGAGSLWEGFTLPDAVSTPDEGAPESHEVKALAVSLDENGRPSNETQAAA